MGSRPRSRSVSELRHALRMVDATSRLSCPNAQKRCLGPLELLLYTFPLGLQKIDKIAVLQVACNLAGGCGEAALL